MRVEERDKMYIQLREGEKVHSYNEVLQLIYVTWELICGR